MKLEEAQHIARSFLCNLANYPSPSLEAIKCIGKVWSCTYNSSIFASGLGKTTQLEVLVDTETGEIVGFRRL